MPLTSLRDRNDANLDIARIRPTSQPSLRFSIRLPFLVLACIRGSIFSLVAAPGVNFAVLAPRSEDHGGFLCIASARG